MWIGPVALRREDGRLASVGRVVVRALLVAEGPSARVVEGVGALDEAHAPAVLLDDLLARRALRLQALDALAGRVRARRAGSGPRPRRPRPAFRGGPPRATGSPRCAAPACLRSASPRRRSASTRCSRARRSTSTVAHRFAQGEELGPEAAVLVPGPGQEKRRHQRRRHHRAPEGPAALGHRAQDQGLGGGRERGGGAGRGLDGHGEQGRVRASASAAAGRCSKRRRGPSRPRAMTSPGAEDRLLDHLAGQEGPLRGAAVEQDHHSVALEDHGVAGSGGLEADVRVRIGADGGGKRGAATPSPRPPSAHVGEADAGHLSRGGPARERARTRPARGTRG